jgi:hypothetical protein
MGSWLAPGWHPLVVDEAQELSLGVSPLDGPAVHWLDVSLDAARLRFVWLELCAWTWWQLEAKRLVEGGR